MNDLMLSRSKHEGKPMPVTSLFVWCDDLEFLGLVGLADLPGLGAQAALPGIERDRHVLLLVADHAERILALFHIGDRALEHLAVQDHTRIRRAQMLLRAVGD